MIRSPYTAVSSSMLYIHVLWTWLQELPRRHHWQHQWNTCDNCVSTAKLFSHFSTGFFLFVKKFHTHALQRITFLSSSMHFHSHQPEAIGYFEDRVGKVRVKGILKQMFQTVNIEGKFTNRSLHAIGTTALYANVSEAIILQTIRTLIYQSPELWMYEWVTPHQDLAVSRIATAEWVEAAIQSSEGKCQ